MKKVVSRAKTLKSLSGLFTQNVESVLKLFKVSKFSLSKEKIKVLKSMLLIATTKQTFKDEQKLIQAVVKSLICQSTGMTAQDLTIPSMESQCKAKAQWVMDPCRQVIKLSQGNLDALAAFCGELTFESKVGVYEVLASYETKELSPKNLSPAEMVLYSKKWERDVIRLFERTINESFKQLIQNLDEDDDFHLTF